MSSHVIMFQPRFAPLVESGAKPTTIRLPRKRVIKVGDELSLRAWVGKPYRSKQRNLRTSVCTRVEDFHLFIGATFGYTHILINGEPSGNDSEIAILDGFPSLDEMRCWFQKTHGLPFTGVRIHWEVSK